MGGQIDFIRGAAQAEDGLGKPIIALHSATNKGETKIVPTLKNGAGNSFSREAPYFISQREDFLDAFSHFYKRVCPSVRLSIRRSVTHELRSCKNAVFDQNYWQYKRERILCRVYGLVFLTS